MTLRERRKSVSALAGEVNAILEKARAEIPESLKNKWNAVLYHYGTKATKNNPPRFRRRTASMKTSQLKSYESLLNIFKQEIKKKLEEKKTFTQAGVGALYPIVSELQSIFYDYFYWKTTSEGLFVKRTATTIRKRLDKGQSYEDIARLIENAFYRYGRTGNGKGNGKGTAEDFSKYVEEISENGRYLI